jgi:single-strand DNA-binding protein
MSFEIEGRLHKIFETEQKTGSFQAREFVLEISSGNYPQLIKFQLTQEKCATLDSYSENTAVKVYFDLRGREWNGKYLTNLNAWRVDAATGNTAAPSQGSDMPMTTAKPASAKTEVGFPDSGDEPPQMPFDVDLPF